MGFGLEEFELRESLLAFALGRRSLCLGLLQLFFERGGFGGQFGRFVGLFFRRMFFVRDGRGSFVCPRTSQRGSGDHADQQRHGEPERKSGPLRNSTRNGREPLQERRLSCDSDGISRGSDDRLLLGPWDGCRRRLGRGWALRAFHG